MNRRFSVVWHLLLLFLGTLSTYALAELPVAPASPSTPVETHPQTRARWAIFAEGAGGRSWSVPTLVSVLASTTNLTLLYDQPALEVGVGIAFYAHAGCQTSPNSQQTCTDFVIRARILSEYLFESQAPLLGGTIGVEGDWFFGTQRVIAFTTKLDIGYGYLFIKSDAEQNAIPIPKEFHLNPVAPHNVLIYASPGLLLNFGGFSKAKGLGLYADLAFAFEGGSFGFLVPVGIRYRF